MKKFLFTIVFVFLMVESAMGMGIIRAWESNRVYSPPPAPATNTPPPTAPEPDIPVIEAPAPTTPLPATHPFVGKRVKTERIAKDILNWKETAHISKASWKGNTLTTSGSFPKWPCKDINGGSMQGNFALAVEQPDGSIVLGTWDWDRCGHQTVKSAGHNFDPSGEHKFFNLRSGCRIWWLITGLSRDNTRNVKERSDFYPDTWP